MQSKRYLIDLQRSRRFPRYLHMEKAKLSNSMIESLPDEMLMEILSRLPAHDIYDKARLVCRRWCHLIHSDAFVLMHFHRASSVLLLKSRVNLNKRRSPILVTATTQGRVQISKLSCSITFPILCSCNGLALCYDLRPGERSWPIPFIFNPATKCAFNLPNCPIKDGIDGGIMYHLSMAYAAASMEYKMVGAYKESGKAHFVMLTVGVDETWRHVEVEGLSPEVKRLIMRTGAPFITGCFAHWVSGTRVVSLNVETEIFTETPMPDHMFPRESYNKNCYHLSTGEYLSLLIYRGDWSWEVWEMKPETWEWRKVLPCLDLESQKCKILQFASKEDNVLYPVGWVRYPEVLAFLFGMGHYCFIYNLDTEKIDSVKLSTDPDGYIVVQHRNTLVWLEKC